ncbi:MAG: Holliday junction resolvase RuvX [Thermosulfidibacteraceae bacterium]|jgi:putative Holliday junction resolvase
MRIVAVDFGIKKCGIAICDPTGSIAQPYKVVERHKILDEIERIRESKGIKEIVIGLPEFRKRETLSIIEEIKKVAKEISELFSVPVYFVDESFTTEEAEEILKLQIKDWRKRKKYKDAISASLILERYLAKGGTPLF